jgi:predicted phosphate transport protein (TIGR00153 family)
MLFKKANHSIELIDNFLNAVDQSVLLFKEGVKYYLYNDIEHFNANLESLAKLESDADVLRREIENTLYTQSLMPQLRSDILRLLEDFDKLIDLSKKNLFQFDVESPKIPVVLNQDFVRLTQVSVSAAESVIPAARRYFRDPLGVKEQLHRVYFYEKETDLLADSLRRKIFKDMTDLKLSEKFHLRYFSLHIEIISDQAEALADLLSIMAIKRTV